MDFEVVVTRQTADPVLRVAVPRSACEQMQHHQGPFVAAKQKASSIVEKPTTLPGALSTFAVGAVAHAKLRAGLSRVNRYDTRADKRFLTLLLLRLAVFVEKKPSAGVSQRLEAMAEAMAPEEKEAAIEEGAVRLGVAAARAPAAVAKAAISAVRFATAAAPKRRSKLVHSALVRGSAASRGGLQSSVVVCDLNGRCCIGNHCFVG